MNKAELVRKIAQKKEGLTQKEAREFLDLVIESIVEGLVEEEKVQLTGFLTLEVKDRPEREGFNPHTRKPMTIPAGKRVSARVSKKVRDLF